MAVKSYYGHSIIALPGLKGHAIGSFQQKGESFQWLRDELPKHIPTARIFTYGYDTKLTTQDHHQLAFRLVAALQCIRSGMVIMGLSIE